MSWDTIKDYMNSFIGILILLIPILLMPEVRRSKFYKIFFVIASIFLFWLGTDKIKRDKKTELLTNKSKDSLNIQIRSLRDDFSKYKQSENEFLIKLKTNFNIGRDSIKNSPIKYNTTIEKARDVYIGDRK